MKWQLPNQREEGRRLKGTRRAGNGVVSFFFLSNRSVGVLYIRGQQVEGKRRCTKKKESGMGG